MEDEDPEPKRMTFGEWRGWAACLLGAVMPTAAVTCLAQMIEGATAPWFGPGLFIGLFTLMVLTLRPWTLR